MTVVPLQSLPLGFRFHPTDEELVNHYLKRKITGRTRAEAEVIPEVDVCKCEPWDLPDKSLIKSDDREWFFFAPKDRKYPNGQRSNRATEAGYWKATGKDRYIRSKKNPAIIGMKKTLVFHKGRAPKGERTQWIMHEYRTTEPDYESGDQGGYVLYRLFNKQEEKSPSPNADEVEGSGFSPAPSRSSPGDTQHDADAMEEIATTSNKESPALDLQEDPLTIPNSVENQPAGIKRWLADKADCSTEADENVCNLNPENFMEEARPKADTLHNSLAQIPEQQNEKVYPNEFSNISSPMFSFTDHPFFGNINQEPNVGFNFDNIQNDEMNEILISLLSGADEYPFVAPDFPKDPVAETVPQHVICDAASWKDSGASSDLEMEGGLNQVPISKCRVLQGASVDTSDLFNPAYLQELQMDAFDEMNLQLSAHYENAENARLLPYNSTQDVYSMDSTAESLQDMYNSVEESSNPKYITGDGGNLTSSGIRIIARQSQPPVDPNFVSQKQGTANRRIRLQKFYTEADSETSSTKQGYEERETVSKPVKDSSVEESSTAKMDIPPTGITIRPRQPRHSLNSNNVVTQQGTAPRRLRLQCKLEVGSSIRTDSVSNRTKEDGHQNKAAETEVIEHADENTPNTSDVPPVGLVDKLAELSVHDADDTPPQPLKTYQEAKPNLRLRAKWTGECENEVQVPISPQRAPGSSIYGTWLVLAVFLLLLCVGIWKSLHS